MRRLANIAVAAAIALAAPIVSRAADPFTITPPLASNALSSCNDLSLSGQVVVDSAGLSTSIGANSGNVVSNGNVKVTGQAAVNGNATAGPGKTVQVSGKAVVTGTASSATTPYDCTPLDLTQLASTLKTTNDNAKIPASSKGVKVLNGTDFSIDGQDSVTLPAGTYYFTSFKVTGGSKVLLGGTARILVTGAITVNGGAALNYDASASSHNAFLLHLWSSGTTFSLANSTLYGFVYAPAAAATIAESRLVGTLFAGSITASGGSTHITRLIDDVPPSVAITSPANNTIFSDGSKIVVTGTASDGQTGLTLKVNGNVVAVNPDGTWTTTLNLSGAGSPVTITALAADVAGNTATAKVTIQIIPPPIITLVSPPNGALVNTRTVNLTGSAGTAATVTVNGQSATVSNGTWTLANFDLGADGTHPLTIVGTNPGGSTTINASITNDTTKPAIQGTITPTPNAAGWNNSNVTVTFACSDTGSGIASCQAPITVSTEGANQTVTGTATDKAGNSATASVTVNLDKTPPKFTFTSHTNNQIVTTPTITVSGGSDDAINAAVNGAAATVDTNAHTFTSAPLTLAEKGNAITVTGKDIAGNPGSATINVILDNIAPHVAITSPANNAVVSADPAHVAVAGTASDDQTSVAGVAVNGHPATLNTDGTWTITLDLSGGSSPATITAVATDAAGNTAPASISVITIPAPAISLTSPAPGALVNTRTVNLAGSAGTSVTVTVNGQSTTVSSGSWSLANFDLGVDGAHTLTIVGTNAGGSTTITPSITNDTTPPTITASASPTANPAGWNNSDVTVTFICSDPGGSGIATCQAPITVSTEGANQTITGTATDKAGNTNTAKVTISLDKTAPKFTITSHKDGQIVNTAQVVISGGSDDAITATVNGVTATIDTTAKTFTSPAITLVEGNNTVTVSGKDIADNSGSAKITLNLDDIPPHVAITSPANNAIVPDPKHVVVSGTASDDQTAVSSVQVNGNPATLNADGTWTITLDLSGGSATVNVTAIATDIAGNSVNAKIDVVILPPPTLTLTLPPPDSFVNTRMAALSGGAGTADSVTVNGQPATVSNGAWSIASFDLGNDGPVTLTIVGTNAGGSSSITPKLFLDTVAPAITAAVSPAPNAAGWNNTNVTVTFSCADNAGGSGIATCPSPIVVSTEAAGQVITGTAVDKAGNPATAKVTLNIDKTAPRFTFTSHTNKQLVSAPKVTIAGGSDDAIAATVNGVAAVIDPAAKTFTAQLTLVEGSNTITVTGSDIAGNSGSAVLTLVVDTQAPQLTITSPAANTCLNASALDIKGTASDANFKSLTVQLGGTTVTPAVDAGGNWTASFTNLPEGKALFTVQATDTVGHTTTSSLAVNIDRTAPAISITESGIPFTATLLNRAVTLFVTTTDADPAPTVTITLDGAAYAVGTPISAEGQHTVAVSATDCAGNKGNKSVQFTIDRTPPTLSNFNPANGGAPLGTLPTAIQGTASEPATVSIAGGAGVHTDASNNFTLTAPFANGVNRFLLHAVDAAGNASDTAYSVTVRANAPVITIADNGTPIASGSLFNRAVTPVITADAADDTITATLNGSAFTSGTAITADGNYTLAATATDPAGHTTNASVSFTVDRTAPPVKITSPANNATVDADSVTVTGTAGDAVSVTVNGVAATLTSGNFTANVTLDAGVTVIAAVGSDAAGNQGRDQISVNRGSTGTGVILTYPPDGMSTNRNTTVITGRVLTPSAVQSLTLEGHIASGQSTGTQQVPRDPSGSFTVTNFALFEGVETITATTTTADGKTSSAVIHVNVDLTPPSAQILAGTSPLDDNSHFPSSVTLTATASDPVIAGFTQAPTTVVLQIDGVAATQPATVSSGGGHTAVAIATDGVGNQTRVTRTFFIGTTTGGTAGCGLTGFDPANNAVVTANSTTLIGRSGGAAGVKINGIPATVANGMFSGTVELSQEGPNSVTIICTDANGNATGDPATITLNRVTAAPSITITSPAEGAVVGTDTITVSGTVQNATNVDVNGAAATITGSTWSATNVHLAAGLNIIVAHAKNAAGAVAIASRRVTYLKNPPTISITWPNDGFSTGAATIDVSGTYTNLDPTSLQSSPAGTADAHAWSDTTGTFVFHGVPLVSGFQAVTVTGHDALNNSASATINVSLTAGQPSITIASPANNSYLPAGASIPVTGAFTGAAGSLIDVNGNTATADTNASTYSGTATFSANNPTVITAHLAQPDGNAALATVLVNQLSGAPAVKAVFPDDGAAAIDPGVMVLVTFSAPMDETTLRTAFTLLDPSNNPVGGQLRLDRDVLSFAPATTLMPGALYTVDIKTGAKDLAGNALAGEFTSKFTISTSAPSTPPTVSPVAGPICASSVTIAGTAPAGSRIEINIGGVPAYATTDSTGNYSAVVTIPQASGYDVARVRIIGADGTFSPTASVSFQVDCTGAQVLGATYDRTANAISVTFSKAIDITTITIGPAGSTQLALSDGTQLSGTVAAGGSPSSVVITPSSSTADPSTSTVILTITTAVKDTTGRNLTAPFQQTFTASGQTGQTPNDGSGYISGQILDASNGRPLPGATVSVDVPVNSQRNARLATSSSRGKNFRATATAVADATGHYTPRLPEGAYAIHASGNGYTDVYRQVVVSAGIGVTPIDIRLTRRGSSATTAGTDLTLTHGGDDSLTRRITLTIPSASAASGTVATLTAVGNQGLPGLLPLGWSPLAAAEIHVVTPSATPLGTATSTLTFALDPSVASSGRAITAVSYDAARDAWDIIQPSVSVGSDGKTNVSAGLPATSADATGANSGTAAVALVYPDAAPFAAPPAPVAGGVLTGVADPCAGATPCPAFTAKSFNLVPPVVTPSGRTVATLVIDGSATAPPQFPSGTAIDALVNEELRLVDGSIVTDQPFSTDLILYRSLDSQTATADFHLAPSANAGRVTLQIGFDHIQILPYPGRLDRGTLIGPAGGRVPSDEQVQINIPEGAATEALHATAKSMAATDLAQFGSIDGFQIVGGFTLNLDPTTTTSQPFASTQLLKSANATFTVDPAVVGSAPQMILAEVLPSTTFGRMFRLADPMAAPQPIESSTLLHVTTAPINVATLPVDGIVRPGQYLLLLAKQPIAFATGTVSMSTGTVVNGAAVVSATLGVRDLSRPTGIYNVPVVAKPASPFALTPTHPSLGSGAPYTSPVSPDPAAVVVVGLTFTIQPPAIQSVTVSGPSGGVDLVANNGAGGISLSTGVQAVFSQSIDPASVTPASITVTSSTGQAVSGTTTVSGTALTWTLAQNTALAVNSTYSVQISGTVRGSFGAPLGGTATYTFSSVAQITSSQINATKIRITIPNARGVSTITGDAGALPTVPPEANAWRAIARRRGNDFITQYQVTANNDGSFSFDIGTCGGASPCPDAVSLSDKIDLEILNAAANIAAIIPLTPFVTADGQGFAAPTDQSVTFTSKDGVSVTAPAGAFDTTAIVTVRRIDTADPFAGVPGFSTELNFYRGVQITMDCTAGANPSAPPCQANKPLDITLPLPSGVDPTGKTFLLGVLGQSVLGPRIMIVDTLRVVNGSLTTAPASAGGSMRLVSMARPSRPAGQSVLIQSDAKNFLERVDRAGVYSALDIRVPTGVALGWMAMDGIQNSVDLFNSFWASLFDSHIYVAESHGRVIMPALMGTPFQVVGYDAGTGIQSFVKAYDPLPIVDPGATYIIDPPQGDAQGPYPVFASPGHVEVVDVDAANETVFTSKLSITRQHETITLTGNDIEVDDTLPDDVPLMVLNVSKGHFAIASGHVAHVAGDVGDRILLIEGASDVDPDSSLSIVFSRRFDTGPSADPDAINTYLQSLIKVWKGPSTTSLNDVTSEVRFSVDSSGLRLNILFPSSLERGFIYRIDLTPNLAEPMPSGSSSPGLKIGQARIAGSIVGDLQSSSTNVSIQFKVRDVATLGSFTLSNGSVRDYDMNGNILFVSALDGGILAYDASDPAALKDPSGGTTSPFARVPQTLSRRYWGIASDKHGRVYATSLGDLFGYVQSFRVEDFVAAPVTPPGVVAKSQGVVCWVPGSSTSLDIDTVISDRPEGIPRKIQLAEQDTTLPTSLHDLVIGTVSTVSVKNQTPDGDFTVLALQVKKETPSFPYVSQRVTIENATRDMRWSADVYDSGVVINNVIAQPSDQLNIIYNERTYAVITIFGYGFGVFDMNAIDSNQDSNRPPNWTPLSERVKITKADVDKFCQPIVDPAAILNLSLSPDLALVSTPMPVPPPASTPPTLVAYGVDVHKGVLDETLHPPTSPTIAPDPCDDRAPRGMILTKDADPWIGALNAKYKSLNGNQDAFGRFNGIQTYYWHLEGADNKPVSSPPGAWGQRHSPANSSVDRTYLLVPGYQLGLIILDTTFPGGSLNSSPDPLQSSLADIIWIPGGAVGVRVIPRTHFAVVVDGTGHVLLVDLSNIDARWDRNGNPITFTPGVTLFPNVATALNEPPVNLGDIGGRDPRIVWISPTALVSGTLPPIIDVDTGMVYAGSIGQTKTNVIAALDPPIRLMANLGNGKLEEVGGVVPLGVDPPSKVLNTAASALTPNEASLAAFRIQMSLPGALADKLPHKLQVSVESERVPGAPVEQTPLLNNANPFPRAHFRAVREDGSADTRTPPNFTLDRDLPDDLAATLKYQKGYNHYLSKWIVAVADPRASVSYSWGSPGTPPPPQTVLTTLGCYSCSRPLALQNKTEADGVFEIWSGGRDFAIKPQLVVPSTTGATPKTIFDGTGYDYLGQGNRFVKRFPTVMADTTRALDVVSSSEAPDVAGGAILGGIYLHSGELALTANDLAAGGRAGWDVSVDRTYRSRSMTPSPFGLGWTSSLFRHLRLLPNSAVEYRDGSGEVFTFNPPDPSIGPAYVAPAGLLLRLVRTPDGWLMVDMKRRVSVFDTLGRLITETDEFGGAGLTPNGNTIRYLYDLNGSLAAVVDPVGRPTKITYWKYSDPGATDWKVGRVKTITDWRQRSVDYDYDANGNLKSVQLVAVLNDDGVARPTILYTPQYSTFSSYNDAVELGPEIQSITDPSYVATNAPRVVFNYTASGSGRGKLSGQTWNDGPGNTAGSSVSVDYSSLKVTDALGHARSYTLTTSTSTTADYNAVRPQFMTMDDSVQSAADPGHFPAVVAAPSPTTATTSRHYKYGYSADHQLQSVTLDGVMQSTFGFVTSDAAAPGMVVNHTTIQPVFAPGPDVMSAGATVDVDYNYQTTSATNATGIPAASDGLFLKSIQTTDGTLGVPQPHRSFVNPTTTNDTNENARYDEKSGLLRELKTDTGTDLVAGNTSHTQIDPYPDADSNLWRRGMTQKITVGDTNPIVTTYDYDWTLHQTTVTDSARGVVTTTKLDDWERPIDVTTTGPVLTLEQTYTYLASGQVHKMTRRQAGPLGPITVTTTYTYDILGRLRDVQTDNAAVDGNPSSTIEKKIDYSVPATTVTTTTTTTPSVTPDGPTITQTLDDLGRPISSKTNAGTLPTINATFGYDAAGNLVYRADNFAATAMAYDAAGRLAGVRHSDGTYTNYTRDAWGNTKDIKEFDSAGAQVGHATTTFTATGRLKQSTRDIGNAGGTRTTNFAWDGAALTTSAVVEGPSSVQTTSLMGQLRARRAAFDTAGRRISFWTGAGEVGQIITAPFVTRQVSTFVGVSSSFPETETVQESGGAQYTHSYAYDTAGNATSVTIGPLNSATGLNWLQQFDEAGNLVSAQNPAQQPTKYEYDGRGAMTKETHQDSKEINLQYTTTGLAAKYTDETGEPTTVTNTDRDLLGRPIHRVYADGTFEQFVWEGPRLQQYVNRAGRIQIFNYYPQTNRLQSITTPGPGGTIITLDSIVYDNAGRILTWTTPGAILSYSNYDFDGHAQQTQLTRLAPDGTTPLGTYTQNHQWNAYGERSSWSMPRASAPLAPWTDTVFEDHDEVGNVAGIRRSLFGSSTPAALLDAQFHSAGRPIQRTLTTSCAGLSACTSTPIVRGYDYNPVGQINKLEVKASGNTVAGSLITYDGVQISDIQLLGLGGQHHSRFHYDLRRRLDNMIPDTPDANADPTSAAIPGHIGFTYTFADFLAAKQRTPRLDPATAAALAAQGIDTTKIDPPSTTAIETAGQKVQTFTVGSTTRSFAYGGSTGVAGANVIDDGKFIYEWDPKDELTAVIQKPVNTTAPIRRIRYFYDGSKRVVGRRAESATPTSLNPASLDGLPWQLETNPSLLAADGLPADTTFVWDPISDQLVSLFDTNAPSGDPNGGLLKQFIHGGMGYDDPLEVTLLAGGTGGNLQRFYPLFDEVGGGSLQAVLNASGQIVARNLPGDPTGADNVDLAGPAIDRIAMAAAKDSSNNLQSVSITVHATEPLDPTTFATGFRLATIDANGNLLRTSAASAQPVTNDAFSATYTLSASDWTALTAPNAAALSVAVSKSLRASSWAGGLTVLPPNGQGALTSTDYPVEVRQSLDTIATWIGNIAASTQAATNLYNVPLLALAGTTNPAADPAAALLTAKFQALPFADPATGLVFARARWYSPETGMFLSVDPEGYEDSSNLYAFAAGDPVNGRDPSGLLCDKRKGESWWSLDFLNRCKEDTLNVAVDTAKGMYDPRNTVKNAKRAAGAVISTGKLVAGVGVLAWDAVTMSVNDAAADRMVARGQAIGNFIAHPIDTTIKAHKEMAERVLQHEQKGEYVKSGEAAASQAQTDYLTAYAAYTLGSGAISRLTPSVTLEPGAYTSSWFADNPLLTTESSSGGTALTASTTTAVATYWPPNRGFVAGADEGTVLDVGTRLSRVGRPAGTFASPEGTPFYQRSLAPGWEKSPQYVYEVTRPFTVRGGPAVPWFGQIGGGMQYESFLSFEQLEQLGYVKDVSGR